MVIFLGVNDGLGLVTAFLTGLLVGLLLVVVVVGARDTKRALLARGRSGGDFNWRKPHDEAKAPHTITTSSPVATSGLVLLVCVMVSFVCVCVCARARESYVASRGSSVLPEARSYSKAGFLRADAWKNE